MIILIAGEKGGTGKTTTAINLSAMRAVTKDLLLIDTDKMESASNWCEWRDKFETRPRVNNVKKFGRSVETEIKALQQKYDDIIIDSAGTDSVELRSALSVVDKVIFPLLPSQFDVDTIGTLNYLVEEFKQINETLQAYILLNRVMPHPHSIELKLAKKFLEKNTLSDITLLSTYLCDRKVFRESVKKGMSVTEYKKDKNAIIEISSLYGEIFNEYYK
jgi:chromosome partitioning protein